MVVFKFIIYTLLTTFRKNLHIGMHPNRLDRFSLNEEKCSLVLNHATYNFSVGRKLKQGNDTTEWQKKNSDRGNQKTQTQ